MEEELFATVFPHTLFGDDQCRLEALTNKNHYGFLAEFHVAQCDEFEFLPGYELPYHWSTTKHIQYVKYAYADTLSRLLTLIEEQSKACFITDLRKFKNKKS